MSDRTTRIVEVLQRHGIKILAVEPEFVTIRLNDTEAQSVIQGLAARGYQAGIGADGSVLIARCDNERLKSCLPAS
jgi:hypothetical protein